MGRYRQSFAPNRACRQHDLTNRPGRASRLRSSLINSTVPATGRREQVLRRTVTTVIRRTAHIEQPLQLLETTQPEPVPPRSAVGVGIKAQQSYQATRSATASLHLPSLTLFSLALTENH